MALKIDAAVVGYGPQPEKNLALVQVTVEFDSPDESMTVKVLEPNDADRKAHEARDRKGAKLCAAIL